MNLTKLDSLLQRQFIERLRELILGSTNVSDLKEHIIDGITEGHPYSPCAKLLQQLVFDNPRAKFPHYVQRELLAEYLERVISTTVLDLADIPLGVTSTPKPFHDNDDYDDEDVFHRELNLIELMILVCRLTYFHDIPLKPEP